MAKRTRKRTITDKEIGLIKAMLSKGMTNAQVHFHFNRADRLISSGRVLQIKRGKYGLSVPEASPSELAAFLAESEIRQTASSEVGPRLPTDRNVLLAMFTGCAGVWTMRLGETNEVECKQSFRLFPDQHSGDLIKAIAGLANNKGGYIFFGIVDRTFIVDGLSDCKFIDTDPSLINRSLAAALDPVPKVTKASIKFGDKTVGVLHMDKHDHAPVVALKNIGGNVKEGTIYYRYVGETRPIKPSELRQIIAHREQRAVAEFTRRMARVAGGIEATIDLQSGEVRGKSGRFVIDKDLAVQDSIYPGGGFQRIERGSRIASRSSILRFESYRRPCRVYRSSMNSRLRWRSLTKA
jgi:Putative DNA-binding domain